MFVINWSPPSILEGIHVFYLIRITGVAAYGEKTTVTVPELETENESASIEHVDHNSCVVYTTCVMAMTEAGEGQPGCVNVNQNRG